jgi:hypothetical protein
MSTVFKIIFTNQYNVLLTVLFFNAVSAGINAFEWLTVSRQFGDRGINSWNLRKIGLQKSSHRVAFRLVDFFYRYPNVIGVLLFQLACSAGILLFISNPPIVKICTIGVAFCYLLLGYRGMLGNNGADSMTRVVFTSATIYFLCSTPIILNMCLIFVTLQLIIAYATPGIIRLLEPKWHNGEYLHNVLRLHSFSNISVWNFISKYPGSKVFLSWMLIIFEFGFLFSIFLPLPLLLSFLLFGMIFHILNAVIMGLNTFVWTFIGTYPAFLWCSLELHRMMV